MATVAPRTVSRGRGAELGLLLLALVLGIGAHALVDLNMTGAVTGGTARVALVLVLVAGGLHTIVRLRAPHADPVLLPVVVALNGIGLAMIYRLDLGTAGRAEPTTFAERQLLWTAFGVALAAVVLLLLRDHRTLRRYTYTAMVVGLALVALPLVPGLGTEINGARIWVRIAGNSLQPAELAKIALAVFFAGYLVSHRDTLALAGRKVLGLRLPRARDLGPILLAWLVSLGVLVFSRDLGTSLLFFGLFVAMLYLATERTSWVVIGGLLFLVGAAVAARAFAHVGARFGAWLNALDPAVYDRSPGGSGQLVQGLFGLANGGLLGTGWGEGYPGLVPFAESDFIVASLGEELGLTGLLAILVLYLVLAQRGLRTAIGVRDGFGKLLAGGLAFVVAFQCFVVVGGVTRLIPLTGLTMPFLAYGGSSLLANWIIVALLIRISDDARRPAPITGSIEIAGTSGQVVLAEPVRVAGRSGSSPAQPVPGTGTGDEARGPAGAPPVDQPTERIDLPDDVDPDDPPPPPGGDP